MKKTSQQLKTAMVALYAIIGLSLSAYTQIQKGLDIYGEAANDVSGWSVSMPDAITVAIGSPYNNGNGTNAGHVRVFTWDGNTWTQKGLDIDSESFYDFSGWSVSMPDANTVAIGAYENNGNGTNAGHVRVYSWNGSAWTQKGSDIDGEASWDNSGYSVSMPDANTVAIGAPYNGGNGFNSGHVRVYTWNGSAWLKKGSDIDGKATSDKSGFFVSMPDANTVAIGAPSNSGNGPNAGHVRIYNWNGSAWAQRGSDINGVAAFDGSGWSVSMPDSNTVAIGAISNDGNGNKAGHVRVFSWNGNAWTQKGSDINGEAAEDQSGWSVSMPNANTVAIGAMGNDGNGENSGHVRVFAWDGNTWSQKGSAIEGAAAGNNSGRSVSMPDAYTIAIGAPNNNGKGISSGHVRVFSLCTPSAGTDVITTCDSYLWIDGITYTASNNTAAHTLTNAAGCDSLITLHLTINKVSDISTISSGPTITANNENATYQWLDCDQNYAIIPGETGPSFTASVNGNYAVQLIENNCVDTSACVTITTVSIIDNSFTDHFTIYPNPTTGQLSITFDAVQEDLQVSLFTLDGKLLENRTVKNTSNFSFEITAPAGIYLLRMSNHTQQATVRVVKE